MRDYLARRTLRLQSGFAGDPTVWTIAGILLIVALTVWIVRHL